MKISQPAREEARDREGWTSRNGVQFPQAERIPHKVVEDGYYEDSMNSFLQTSLSAVKMYTTCRHGHYLCCGEIRKRFYGDTQLEEMGMITVAMRLLLKEQLSTCTDNS